MSTIGVIEKSTMQAIVDAVRLKTGNADLIPVNALADIIANFKIDSNKLPQVIDRSITEITAEDLEGVTEIGDHVFFYCTGLTSVDIPNSITSIGEGAFNGCSSLTSVTIGDSVMSISAQAFEYCSSLPSVTIGNSVKSIGSSAFAYCDNLTEVRIGKGITSINSSAFSRCTALTDIYIDAPEDSISGAPWGAPNSPTIHWNTPLPTEEE